MRALRKPKILLAGGEGTATTTYGDFWYFIEEELQYPIVPVRVRSLSRIDLDRYNVLILPSGSADELWRELGESGASRLEAWVRAGGLVIAVGGALDVINREELALTTVKAVAPEDSAEVDPAAQGADSTTPRPPLISPTAGKRGVPEFIPGAIFRGTLDLTHWLTLGYDSDQLPVFLQTSRLLEPSRGGDNPVALVGADLTLAGFTWPDQTERMLEGTAWLAAENVDRGVVVVFADNPLFRGFWRATAKLVTNALLIGPRR